MAENTGAFKASGAKLYVSEALPATHDAAGFGALAWTQVKDITDVPAIGDVYEVITHQPLDSEATFKILGGSDAGDITLGGAMWSRAGVTDPGQDIINDNLGNNDGISFKKEYADNPGGTSNSIRYFIGKVVANQDAGARGGLTTIAPQIAISGKVVKVDPVA